MFTDRLSDDSISNCKRQVYSLMIGTHFDVLPVAQRCITITKGNVGVENIDPPQAKTMMTLTGRAYCKCHTPRKCHIKPSYW